MRIFVLVLICLTFFAACTEQKMQDLISLCNTGNTSTFSGCVFEQAEKTGPKLCLYVDDLIRDECYLNAALGTDDDDICERIIEPVMQANCYGSIAMYNDRLKVVGRIKDREKKYEWYTSIALREDNWEICRKILEDPQAHGSCIYEMAKRSNDPDLCFFVDENTLHRDACYYHMAKHYKNSTYCIGVEGLIMKAHCEDDSVIPLKVTGRMVEMVKDLLDTSEKNVVPE